MVLLANLILMLKINGKNKKVFFYINRSKIVLLFLELLYKEGFISGFKVYGYVIKVYLKYDSNTHVIKNIKLVSKSSNRVYRSFKYLKNKAKKNEYYIISSDKGLVYTRDFMYIGSYSGGEILCLLN